MTAKIVLKTKSVGFTLKILLLIPKPTGHLRCPGAHTICTSCDGCVGGFDSSGYGVGVDVDVGRPLGSCT